MAPSQDPFLLFAMVRELSTESQAIDCIVILLLRGTPRGALHPGSQWN